MAGHPAVVPRLAFLAPLVLLTFSGLPPSAMATRQGSLNSACFFPMQAVTLATSGMNSAHNRIASGVQACLAALLTSALAPSRR